eukprot:m.57745 g.57745  ORF g.57745 m.57745 type:complete len:523 (-) comp13744_c0_seq1:31-1599(-)
MAATSPPEPSSSVEYLDDNNQPRPRRQSRSFDSNGAMLSRKALRRSQKVTEMLLALHRRQSLALLDEPEGEEEFDQVDPHGPTTVNQEDEPEFDLAEVEQLLQEMTTVVPQGERQDPTRYRTSSTMVDTLSHVTASNAKLSNAVLTWEHPVHNILIIKKRGDANVAEWFGSIAQYLVEQHPNVSVFFPPRLFREDVDALKSSKAYTGLFRKLHTWEASRSFVEVAQELAFDLVVCLGGDGTLLHMASLFQSEVPPVMCFALGSLGFLTTFDVQTYQSSLEQVLDGGLPVTIRMRLVCKVDHVKSKMSVSRASKQDALLKEFGLVTANAVAEYHVLNELIVDRGPSPYLTQLDVWIDDEYVTCVQGDGLIVATPTGSTAYSAAAGGSMVHPSVPCVLLTPVCPHNVTSRPIVVPAAARIKLSVPVDARSEAFAAFDGRNRQRLRRGESISITSSRWPVPCITQSRSEWFQGLHNCLGWNQRHLQQPFQPSATSTASASPSTSRGTSQIDMLSSRPPPLSATPP